MVYSQAGQLLFGDGQSLTGYVSFSRRTSFSTCRESEWGTGLSSLGIGSAMGSKRCRRAFLAGSIMQEETRTTGAASAGQLRNAGLRGAAGRAWHEEEPGVL
jgi:hypothetical protein